MSELSYTRGHDVVVENFKQIVFIVDFTSDKRVVADVKTHVLRFEVGDSHLERLVRRGGPKQGDPVAMQNHLQIQIVRTNRIDVILDVAHGTTVFLVVRATFIVDVVDDLLLAIRTLSIRLAGKYQSNNCQCGARAQYSNGLCC